MKEEIVLFLSFSAKESFIKRSRFPYKAPFLLTRHLPKSRETTPPVFTRRGVDRAASRRRALFRNGEIFLRKWHNGRSIERNNKRGGAIVRVRIISG